MKLNETISQANVLEQIFGTNDILVEMTFDIKSSWGESTVGDFILR